MNLLACHLIVLILLRTLTWISFFLQDDAHIFCRESQVNKSFLKSKKKDNCTIYCLYSSPIKCNFILQVKNEVKSVLEFIDYVYKIFGFTYELELSTVEPFLLWWSVYWYVSNLAMSLNICDFLCYFRGQRNIWGMLRHGIKLRLLCQML